MGVLLFKPGVRITQLAPAGSRILDVAANLAAKVSFDWLVTCVTGGHPPGNPHTRGEACDFGLGPFPSSSAIAAAKRAMELELGTAYTVLLEVPEPIDDPVLKPLATVNPQATAPHFHSQIRKGTTTIPVMESVTT